jgi:hypothetical protein
MIEKPERYSAILGSQFIRELMDPENAALRIGKDIWTKHEVATDLGIVQTKACGILSNICKKLEVKNTADLFKSTSPYTFAGYPAGVTTLYVMFAAFAAKGLDPNEWYNRGQDAALVSFLGLKHRELMAARRTKEEEQKRQRKARANKHRADVNRVMQAST